MMLLQRTARALLGDALVLTIDPAAITQHAGPDRPVLKRYKAALESRGISMSGPVYGTGKWYHDTFHPFILHAQDYPATQPIESEKKYNRMRDLLQHRERWQDSAWYRAMKRELEQHGRTVYKEQVFNDAKALDAFFREYMLGLVESMERHGYERRFPGSMGYAMIAADGTLQKANNASHRFAIARELGMQKFPLEVRCVHADWAAHHGLTRFRPDRARWRKALRAVEMAARGERSNHET